MKLAITKKDDLTNSSEPSEPLVPLVKEKSKFVFGIKGKLILVLSGFSLFIVLVIGIIAYLISKSAIEVQAFNQLTSIRETKKKAIEDYFQQIENQVVSFSEDITVIESVKEFSNEFNYLDTNYNDAQIQEFKSNVLGFYSNQFVPKLNENLKFKESPESFLPRKKQALVAQNYYIAQNTNPLGEKNNLNSANDGSGYSNWHQKVHPIFNSYLQKFGYYDIFLVNLDGDIVYTVFKEVDYGTNLLNGPYKNTNFADVYKRALGASNSDFVALEDFKFYKPSYNAPASFIASPIFDGNKKVGVLIFQMPVDNINSIMTGDQQWASDGLGLSGETYLVAGDKNMRSISRFLIEDPTGYFEALEMAEVDEENIDLIKKLETSILIAPVNTLAADEALKGKSDQQIIPDYRGVPVLSAYSPLEIDGLDWAILSEIDEAEAFQPIYEIRNSFIITGLILALIAALVANIFSAGFTKPIIALKNIFEKLALGILPPPIKIVRKDEIGQTNMALNTMVESLHSASKFALEIGEGKFNSNFQPKSEEDTLGNALTQMRNRLSEVATEERKRSWGIEGLAIFSDILRQDNDNIEVLSNRLVSKMIDYLGANQGAIFVVNDEDHLANDPVLKLTGCYAYDRQKYIDMAIKKGQGLVGQCWIEGKRIFLTAIPDEYINIHSGLGDAAPNSVLIVPLMVNDEIHGVIELAGFKVFEEYEIEFVEKVAESIASTLKGVKVNMRTVNLLNESKNQAEVMQQQEEEMRQNME